MSQHDFNLANASGSAFRSDLNNALSAILSNNSSTVVPTTTEAYMWHADVSANVMHVRDQADALFIKVFKMTASAVMPYILDAAGEPEIGSAIVQRTNNNTFAKAQRAAIASVTYASTLALDLNDGNNFQITPLSGNLTLSDPSAITSSVGQGGSIWVKQDGAGSRTISFGSMWKFSAGTAPTASTASGTTDRVDYKVRNASTVDAAYTLDVS